MVQANGKNRMGDGGADSDERALGERAGLRNPFEVLGLSPGATAAQVKTAYRRLCARHHPDARHHRDARRQPELQEAAVKAADRGDAPADDVTVFLEIQSAYRLLSDRRARALWESKAAISGRWPGTDAERMPIDSRFDDGPLAPEGATSAHLRRAAADAWLSARIAAIGSGRPGMIEKALLALLGLVLAALLAPHWVELARNQGLSEAPLRWDQKGPDQAGLGVVSDAARTVGRSSAPAPSGAIFPGPPGAIAPTPKQPNFAAPQTPDGGPLASGSRPEAVSKRAGGAEFRTGGVGSGSSAAAMEGSSDRQSPRPADPAEAVGGPGVESAARVVPLAAMAPADGESGGVVVPARANRDRAGIGKSEGAGAPGGVDAPGTEVWWGRWRAVCMSPTGTKLFVATLDIGDRTRFRWRSLSDGESGSRAALRLVAGEGNSAELRDASAADSHAGAASGASQGVDGARRTLALLEWDAARVRKLRWLSAEGLPAGGCREWSLFADSQLPPQNGIWVLAPGGKVAEDSFAPEYVELRLEHRGTGFDGRFQGRYAVPARAMQPELRFQFRATAENVTWQIWTGSFGPDSEVTVAMLGDSRLAVYWRRAAATSGRPQLTSGLSVLRRME